MSPKNSHGFQNVSIFLQNLFKSFRISGTRISATHHTCTNSMQLTHFNLGMSQPTKAENLALKSQILTHPKMPLFGPFFGPKKLVTYFQIHQGANQTHWNQFRAKYGCLQKIPMDSKMSPFFYKIFSSHFESREPGFLQWITLVLPLGNSPATI